MAAPSSGRQSRTLCTFYEKGSCRYGASCRFTHGTSDSRELRADGAAGETQTPRQARPTASTSSKEPCRFFAKGKCVRGASCRFLHSATGSDDSSPAAAGDGDETGRRPRSSSGKATPNGGCAEGDEDRGRTVTTAKRPARPCPSPGRKPSSAPAAAVAGDSRVRPEGVCVKRGYAGCSSSKRSGGSSGGDEVARRLQRSWTDIVTKDVPMDAGGGTASPASTAITESGSSSEENDNDAEEPIAPARRKLAANAADKRDRNTARAAAAAAAADTSAPAPGAAAPLDQRRTQPAGGSDSGESDGKGKQAKQACVFFARGRCRYGDRCRFSHDAVEETPAAGGGARGSHGGGGSAGRKEKRGVASEPSSHESEGFGEDEVAAREAALDEAEKIQSRSAECGICLEKVRKLGKVKDRVFGILVSCRHVYCLGCIREWRDKSDNHACPECGLTSSLVIPSKTLVTDPDRKKRLALELRQSPRGTPSVRRL
ncbi:conserved unknown protein [Ectocarpus siliculosus]|uniref:Uncharacterized protein n=1 Tax=Ectocarpus siliculosus TaxID=2880 RepID=D7G211_ECTSI|nr:conserved unknown protein [Ectocarpus siliculosus]|eukprot:CBJ48737.1 conserved unknown protein [Ectocarpus siliculosus]